MNIFRILFRIIFAIFLYLTNWETSFHVGNCLISFDMKIWWSIEFWNRTIHLIHRSCTRVGHSCIRFIYRFRFSVCQYRWKKKTGSTTICMRIFIKIHVGLISMPKGIIVKNLYYRYSWMRICLINYRYADITYVVQLRNVFDFAFGLQNIITNTSICFTDI